MGVQGRLKDGSLSITGEINERLPAIQNGLVAHYPFDGVIEGESFKRNLLDTSQWVVGRKGSQGNFEINGTVDENEVILYKNPWGYEEPVWASLQNDTASDADGGWNVLNIPIDNTKKYRLSVWIRRENFGNGSAYLGCQASTVANLSNDNVNTNPYFTSGNFTEIRDEWVLFVGYIHPHNYTGDSDQTNGMYSRKGNKLRSMSSDFKWTSTATVGGIRSYLFYSTKVDERQYWVRPRFEVCDGTESTIQDLLNNRDDVVYPLLNRSTTLSNDGIAVEEATVNKINPLNIQNAYPLEWKVETLAPYTYKITALIDSPTIGYAVNTEPYKASDQESITMSAEYVYKSNNALEMGCGGFGKLSDSSSVGKAGVTGRRSWRTIKYTPWEHRLALCYVHSGNRNLIKAGDFLIVKEPQIESKAFATSFTSNSRVAGLFNANFNLKPPYSINLWHRGNLPLEQVINQPTSPMIFQMNVYYTNASISFWNYNKVLNVFIKGDSSSGWTSTKSYYPYSNDWDNKEHMYTLVAVDNRKFKVYMDGVYLGEQISSEDVTNITYLSMGNASMPNAQYRDLSMYSKALSDVEIEKLYKKTFSLNEYGSINTGKIVESPNGIPKDSIHIPLDLNSKDRLNLLGASRDVDTVYEDGSVWVGTAYNNLLSYPEFSSSLSGTNWSWWNSSGISLSREGVAGRTTNVVNLSKRLDNGSNNAIHQAVSGLTIGTAYTLSFYARINPNSPVSTGEIRGYIKMYENQPISKEWKKIVITQSASSTSETIHITQANTNYDVQIALVQLQARPFASPFVQYLNNASSLEFNLNRDYQLNWSEDWSIVYWKKAVGTGSNNLNGYSIESLGSNSNSVGKGYVWWGKENNSNAIRVNSDTSSPPFNPSNYFNNWQMISIVKSGNNITFNIKSDKLEGYKRVLNIVIGVPNYYVNQYGYDFKMGGYDYNNPQNAYYKDLIIAKRAFTDIELETLYKTQMRVTKDGLRIQNSIKENIIL